MLEPKLKPVPALGLMILREGQVLLARRKGALGTGEYSFPGGKLENGESFEAGVLREFSEECGDKIKIKNLRFLVLANILHYRPRHFVNVCFVADWESGEAMNTEPEKLEAWTWYPLERLPFPLFVPSKIMIDAYKSGKSYINA
jgi:8-oxo-dGTP diphosphatase